jgi:hypothetical protein
LEAKTPERVPEETPEVPTEPRKPGQQRKNFLVRGIERPRS